MKGRPPAAVTAVTQQLQPDVYPKVDDEANVILSYSTAVAIIQGSWNWPFDRKDMAIYGRTGYARTVLHNQIEVRRSGERQGRVIDATQLKAPYDDPLHYLAAVIHGDISEDGDLSSLKTNVIVSEILDAARTSAASGKRVTLPLND